MHRLQKRSWSARKAKADVPRMEVWSVQQAVRRGMEACNATGKNLFNRTAESVIREHCTVARQVTTLLKIAEKDEFV